MIGFDTLKVMDMLERTFESSADRWQALRMLLEIQKFSNNQKAPKESKRGRPRKVGDLKK